MAEIHTLRHRALTLKNGEGLPDQAITPAQAFDAADSKERQQVLALHGVDYSTLVRELAAQTGSDVGQVIEWSDDKGKSWNPERRLRAINPESFSMQKLLQRIRVLQSGENLKLSLGVPRAVLDLLQRYVISEHLSVQMESTFIRVTKLKDGGIYDTVRDSATDAWNYRLRAMGDHSNQMQKLNPDLELKRLNIGNVPAGGWHLEDFQTLAIAQAEFGWNEGRKGAFATKVLATANEGENPGEVLDEIFIGRFENNTISYPPTLGVKEFRDFVLRQTARVTREHNAESVLRDSDIIPTNGAADAIVSFRLAMADKGRILHVGPTYPVQVEFELMLARLKDPDARPMLSMMKPDKEQKRWKPDLDDIITQSESNEVKVISIVNPGNPTGDTWTREDLVAVCEIAKKNNCILEVDETYWQLVREGETFTPISVLAKEMGVQAVVYKSVSKDLRVCGRKFGWFEFHDGQAQGQTGGEPFFQELKDACMRCKMEQVGATALFQYVAPIIMEHPEFPEYLKNFNNELFAIADDIANYFQDIDGVTCFPARGAMYTTLVFEDGVLTHDQSLNIVHDGVRGYVEREVDKPGMPLDERLAMYICAATGVVVTPLSGFHSNGISGLRICNLERNESKRGTMLAQMKKAIRDYLNSV